MSRIEIGDPDEIKSAATKFAEAAAVPADAAAQVAQRLVLSCGPVRSELDDRMADTLDRIGGALDAAARTRAGCADAIGAAAADAVEAIVAADEDAAAQIHRTMLI